MSAEPTGKLLEFMDAQKRSRGGGDGEKSVDVRGLALTDLGNGLRFVRDHGDSVRYCEEVGKKWYVWETTGEQGTGGYFRLDNTKLVNRLGKITVESIVDEKTIDDERPLSGNKTYNELRYAHYLYTQDSKGLRNMLDMASSELPIAVRSDDFDKNQMLLNLVNGTYDLAADEFRAARRADLMTKQAQVVYDAEAPAPETWIRIHKEYFNGDEGMFQFLHRAYGYALTGDVSERVVFIFQGATDAGKSTILRFLHWLMAGYAVRIPTERLMQKRGGGGGGIPNDIMRMRGARIVSASEMEEDKRLAEGQLKELVANDIVTARHMKAEWVDFEPTHKLFIGTNPMPRIHDSSGATWNKIRLVKFNRSIPKEEQDPYILDTLKAEASGILNLMLQGCRDWREHGLGTTSAVTLATNAAKAEQDTVGLFLEECTQPTLKVEKGALYQTYKRWAEENQGFVLSKNKFGRLLIARGTEEHNTNTVRYWVGLSLKPIASITGPPTAADAHRRSQQALEENPALWKTSDEENG